MPIRQLPPLLVNQIAAGEVIERPASVLKELVENSLDAGATRVEVAVEEGGVQLIRIRDDGHGIAPEELPLAVASHATSKLVDVAGLAAIRTLGFRGEALASIASVSRTRIMSRQRDSKDEAGAVLDITGDQLAEVQPHPMAPGTVIEVRDLFFNTPARRKFLRAASTELGQLHETLQRLAMVHPHVQFHLTHNGRVVRDLPACNDPYERCIDLLGRDIEDALLRFDRDETRGQEAMRVWGVAGLPSLVKANTRMQYLYINRRAVKDRQLTHAVREAYRGLMPPDKHPVAVVFVEMDPEQVDVNVHPAKAEVRFRNPSQVHGMVLASIRQRLLASNLTPSVQLGSFDIPRQSESASSSDTHAGHVFQPNSMQQEYTASPAASMFDTSQRAAGHEQAEHQAVSGFVDYFRRMDPKQRGFAFEQVKQELAKDDPSLLEKQSQATPDVAAPTSLRQQTILQVHQSYVVTQDEQGLLIVDQHALHERVMFEELSERLFTRQENLESQRLLMPVMLDADHARQDAADQLKPLLMQIGVELAPMGPNTLAVHAFPSFLFERHVEPEAFVSELLDRVVSGDIEPNSKQAREAALHKVIDMMSCKAAIKAGDAMSEQELQSLLARREQIERSSNCPHGRPTTLRLTLRDLEKQFKRT